MILILSGPYDYCLQNDYLTIEHNTGLDLKDEFILVGRDLKNEKVNFTVHSLKSEEAFRRKKVVVHEISENIFVASTQFERPFDYSTSSWVRGNDCNKNISKFKVIQKHYGTDFQTVEVALQNSPEHFSYFLTSVNRPPYFKFTVPGWSFKNYYLFFVTLLSFFVI